MKSHHSVFAVLLGSFLAVSGAGADAPSTQPLDASTPMAFMVSYDQMAGQDPTAYQSMYSTDDADDTRRLAQEEAKFDSEVGILQKMVQQKWGEDAVDQTLHALGLKSLRDIQAATIKEAGHHASVIFADGTPGPDLVKAASGWRLDLPAFAKSLGMPVDEYLKQIHQLSKILPEVADGIAEEKLKDPSDVVGDIAKRINASAHP